jgi:hypothetical protein
MKITMESTEKIMLIDGVEVRVWDGVVDGSGGGVCYVLVHRIAIPTANALLQDRADKELIERLYPESIGEIFFFSKSGVE